METNLQHSKNYLQTLEEIKSKVKTAQIKAHLSVNKEMLILYWQIGKIILNRQEEEGWGSKIIDKLSNDLKKEFSTMKGFSSRNLKYMRLFSLTYLDLLIFEEDKKMHKNEIVHQVGAQFKNNYFINNSLKDVLSIPWRHNTELLDKLKDQQERLWYARKTIENSWSRNVLVFQIQSNLYQRQATKEVASNNFQLTLPKPQSDLALEIFKDQYNLEFIDNKEGDLKERKLENALIDNVIQFLTELGKGFAFVGKQYHLEVAGQNFYLDLLFYHLTLRCFIVIELKTTKFKPEYAGKMAFYLAQVDKKLKKSTDNYSVGIILCQKSNLEIQEDTINYITKPIGVAGYQLAEDKTYLPKELEPLEELKHLL